MLELLEQQREGLRCYADLARFANTFRSLRKPLGLKMPLSAVPATGAASNGQAGLETLEPDDADETDAVRTRRSAAAGPIPTQYEVVRMLLALDDRTLSTPLIRKDLAWEAPENEARRVHTRVVKKENERWEDVKKKLAEARVELKSPPLKANKDEVSLSSDTCRSCGS